MSRGKKVKEDPKTPVPSYIVTFSDMVTLLLTFFVLLLSLAESQDENMFKIGQTSFKRALSNFGLQGFLTDTTSGPDMGYAKVKYKVDVEEKAEDSEERSIDYEMEMLRRAILELERNMDISPSQLRGSSKMFTVADIRFDGGSYALDDPDLAFLSSYCSQLEESYSGESPTVYVVGLAGRESGERKQWMISARRAEVVADYMRGRLSDPEKWHIFCWGAGSGGDWADVTGLVSEKADILIAVLTEGQ